MKENWSFYHRKDNWWWISLIKEKTRHQSIVKENNQNNLDNKSMYQMTALGKVRGN